MNIYPKMVSKNADEVYLLKKMSTLMEEVDGLNGRWYYVTTMSARRLKI